MASSKGALWLTIAAAAGTLVVAGGLVAGPAIVACSSDPAGLLACLRQDVVEAGLLPASPEPEQTAAVVSPTPEIAPEAARAAPAPPDLNLIRAAPDGHVIVAGSAEPGIEVEVFANGDLVGKTMAEASGDWVLVPDRPLAVGTAEVSVGISGSNERSPRTFTVTIAADKTSAPTVTASEPVSSVAATEPAPETPAPAQPPVAEPKPQPISAPETEAAPVENVAEAPAPALQPKPEAPFVDEDPEPAPQLALAPEAKPLATEPPKLLPEAPTEQVSAPAPAPTQPVPAPAMPEMPPQTAEPPERVAAEPTPVPAPAPVAGHPAPEKGPEPVVPAEAEPVPAPAPADPPMRLAEAEPPEPPAPVPPVTPIPEAPTTIDAIEIDGSANFFAGAGPEGAIVELYVENRFIAAAKVEGGRWLVEARGVLNLPAQRVRIDLVDPEQGVSARAEVNFVIDVPPPMPEIEASATATGEAATPAEIATELAVAPQVEPELEIDPAIPTLHAMPTADPKMLRFASGKAIIRRGETLWAIAERVYGDGREYRRIVEANDDQISRPGRIFPGQVFDLPKLEDGN